VRVLLTIHDSLTFEKNDFDITAYGEVLLDMISREEAPLKECANFTRYFGGSPANVLVNMQRLENKTAFISRVGKDEFGEYLTEILKKEGVNLDCLQHDQEEGTPIIFVNKSKKTPSWLAYRGADINIKITEKIYNKIDNSSIFFTGSFILSKNPARTNAVKAVEHAVEKNKVFAFDPSFRAILWPEGNKGSEIIRELLAQADFIKPSLDDAYHLYGQDHPENYLKKYHNDGAKIVILTLGKDGVLLSDGKNEPVHIPVFSEKVVDVTGAGDSFWSGFLTGILKGLPIVEAAKLGNAVAAFKIQGVGALSSVPPLMEIISYYDIQPIEGGNFNA
jgi:fructokinase